MASTATQGLTTGDQLLSILQKFDTPRSGFLPRDLMVKAVSQIVGPEQGDLVAFTKDALDKFVVPGQPCQVDYRKFVEFMLPGKGALSTVLEIADCLLDEHKRQQEHHKKLEKHSQAMCPKAKAKPKAPSLTPEPTPRQEKALWSIHTWLSEHVGKVIASSLTTQVQLNDPDQELAFARALGYVDRAAGEQVVLNLLKKDGALEKLASCVVALAAKLVEAQAATGKELNDKFAASDGVFPFSFGCTADFFGGLEDLIGSPNPDVRNAMHNEHCDQPDSNITWMTAHYGITTTPNIEWHFVVSPDRKPEAITDWPKETRNVGNPRRPTPLEEYQAKFDELNQRLLELQQNRLMQEEMIGCRLYTGPMFEKYNAVNRGGARREAKTKQKGPLVEKFQKLCKGNRYCTTLHVINSALIKLSKLQPAEKLYRGTVDGVLPPCFWQNNTAGVCGGIEFGFLSTSTEPKVAQQYVCGGKAATVLEIETGMIDRGANLEHFSQYPHEKEVCFPPLTGMQVLSSRVEGHILFVKMRLNVNFCALTIEQVIGKRHKVVKDMCDNLRFEAQTNMRWNLADGRQYEDFIDHVVREAVEKDFDQITQRSPEQFNNDVMLLSAIRRALDVSDSVKWQKSTVLRRAALELRRRAARYRLMRLVWKAARMMAFRSTWDNGNQAWQQEVPTNIDKSENLRKRHEQALAAAEELEKKAAINENVEFKDIDVVTVRREDTRRLGLSGGSARGLILEKLKLKEEDGIIYVSAPSELWPAMQPGYMLVGVNKDKGDPEGLAKAIVHEAGAELTFRRPLETGELTETLIKLLQGITEGNKHEKKFLVERCLALNRQWKAVSLRHISFTQAAGKVLAQAMKKNRTIQLLFMEANKAGPDMAQELEHSLRQNKTLQTLDIRANDLLPAGGEAIARALKENTTLHTLGVPRNQLGPDGGAAIAAALEANKGLQTLFIQGNKLGEKGGKAFGQALNVNQTLSALHIDSNNLGAEGGEAIANALCENRTLRRLWIPDNNLGERGGKAIAQALKANIPLHSLGMAGNRIGVNAVEALAVALKDNRNLTDLGIENNELGVAGGEHIAKALSDNRVLRTLRLKGNSLGDESCIAIANALQEKNRSLTTLYIDDNNIGPEGARALAEALQANPTFQVLGIERNKIGSEGGKFLAGALQRSTTLQTLWADGNNLGGEGGLALAKALTSNKGLETLGMKNNGLTKQVGKELAFALEKNPTLLKLMITGDEVGAEAIELINQKNQGNVNVDMKSN